MVDAGEEERFAHVERKQVMLALSYAIDFILFPVNFLVPRDFSSKTAARLCSTKFCRSASLGTEVVPMTIVSETFRNGKKGIANLSLPLLRLASTPQPLNKTGDLGKIILCSPFPFNYLWLRTSEVLVGDMLITAHRLGDTNQ